MTKIFIDPGHGGTDPGAVGNGIQEKNINLEIAKEMEKILTSSYENVEVKLSRTSDSTVSLSERTKEANLWKADVFISIHVNAATSSSARGFETFIYPNSSKSTALQNVMHQEIVSSIKYANITDRGKKTANFHVLRETAMIALLSENLFISNSSDASLLKQDKYIDATANGHVNGLAKFYGLKKKATPTPPKDGTLYQVITGTFSDRDNAEQRAKDLKADGYDSYIQEKK